MCSLCGTVDADHHWAGGGGGADSPAQQRQQRLRLAALANALLAPARIAVEDFGGQSFVVRSPTGAAEVVGSLPEVWRAAERLGRARVDPLGPHWVD